MIKGIISVEDDLKLKGRWITCKFCKKKFKFKNNTYRKSWAVHKYECPFCETTYCILTPTEKELRTLQDKYFESNKNEKYLNEMFKILVNYAKSLIKKNFGNKYNFATGMLEEYATDAVSLFMEKYSDSKFKVHTSFGKFLNFKVLERMFGKKYHVVCDETIHYKFNDGNFIEHEDPNRGYLIDIEKEEHYVEIKDEILSLIYDLKNICSSDKVNYRRLIALLIYLRNNEISMQKFFDLLKDKLGKEETLRTIDLLHSTLLTLTGWKNLKHIVKEMYPKDDQEYCLDDEELLLLEIDMNLEDIF